MTDLYQEYEAALEEGVYLSTELKAARVREKALEAFIEEIVKAGGKYPELNGTAIVEDAYKTLVHHKQETEK